jgi:hypothetical protein
VKGKGRVEDVIDRKVMLKCTLKEWDMRIRILLDWLKIGKRSEYSKDKDTEYWSCPGMLMIVLELFS